jgi:CHAD domain-containing protein
MKRAKPPRWDAGAGAIENARSHLPSLVEEFFAAGRKAIGGSPARLHQFRLRTKHFRYTLEVFRPLYGPGLEARLKSLRHLQQLLGELNDYETTRGLVAAETPRAPGSIRIGRFLDQATVVKTKEFEAFWQEFDAPGQLDRWLNYLTRFAGRVG